MSVATPVSRISARERHGRRVLLAVLAVSLACLVFPAHARRAHHETLHPCVTGHPPQALIRLDGAEASVDFSPAGQGAHLVLDAIDTAQSSILVQAYSFTDARILKALVRAHERGVQVQVILDKSDAEPEHGRAPVAEKLYAAGIPVWIDWSVSIAHSKVMVIDGDGVITGSYNFTYAAQHDNAENLIYIHHAPALAAVYAGNWRWRQNCSRIYSE